MRYQNVCLEAFGYTLPPHVVSSADIEAKLAPLYERLRLPRGRLELMSGIRERRLWDRGTLPSENSIRSGAQCLAAAEVDPSQIGTLVHASVCRDFLEPATASLVHHRLGLPGACQIFDLSNACLGVLNGMLQVANMIELGQIRAGLVVSSEGSRELLETTIDYLNRDTSLTRQTVKPAMASLTIGSASVAVLLCDRELSRYGTRLLGGVAAADTTHVALCQSGRDEAASQQMAPLMHTDAESLLTAGVALAQTTFEQFLGELNWSPEDLHKTVGHQVGQAHRRLLCDMLGIESQRDFTSYEILGNTGSAALPVTTALATQADHFDRGDRVGLFGIGSGINCVMLGVDWQGAAVEGIDLAGRIQPSAQGSHYTPVETQLES